MMPWTNRPNVSPLSHPSAPVQPAAVHLANQRWEAGMALQPARSTAARVHFAEPPQAFHLPAANVSSVNDRQALPVLEQSHALATVVSPEIASSAGTDAAASTLMNFRLFNLRTETYNQNLDGFLEHMYRVGDVQEAGNHALLRALNDAAPSLAQDPHQIRTILQPVLEGVAREQIAEARISAAAHAVGTIEPVADHSTWMDDHINEMADDLRALGSPTIQPDPPPSSGINPLWLVPTALGGAVVGAAGVLGGYLLINGSRSESPSADQGATGPDSGTISPGDADSWNHAGWAPGWAQ